MENRVQNLIKFEQYGFKPSAVIEALNKWYEHGTVPFFKIERPDSKEGDRKYYTFYDHDKAIDAAIKYLRSFDIFYTPGMKWDDVKFKLNSRACLAEFGFNNVYDAWPKVNPCFVGPRTERENEIRDYILKRADMNGIKVPESFRDPDAFVENLIAYLFEKIRRLMDESCVLNSKVLKLEDADRLRRHWHSKYEKEHEECVRLSKLHAADKEKKDKQDATIRDLGNQNATLGYSVAALKKRIRTMKAEAAEKETKTKVITDTLRDNLVDSIEECKRLNGRIRLLEDQLKLNGVPPLEDPLDPGF